MAEKLKLYLDTTVFNYYFLDDPGREDDRKDTMLLFEQIGRGSFDAYYSDLVKAEIDECEEPKRTKMLRLIERYSVRPISVYHGYEDLAELYLTRRAIPESKRDDAIHVALATVNSLDVVLSWNRRHLVKVKTIFAINEINEAKGFGRLLVTTPTEVIDYEENP